MDGAGIKIRIYYELLWFSEDGRFTITKVCDNEPEFLPLQHQQLTGRTDLGQWPTISVGLCPKSEKEFGQNPRPRGRPTCPDTSSLTRQR